MKILKVVLYGAAGVVALLIVAAVAVALVVDGAFVKTRLERAMKEKNRTLKIEGEPKLRLFPVAGIALGKTSLSEPGSDRVFVALESAEVAVRVPPLLSGEVAVEMLEPEKLWLHKITQRLESFLKTPYLIFGPLRMGYIILQKLVLYIL